MSHSTAVVPPSDDPTVAAVPPAVHPTAAAVPPAVDLTAATAVGAPAAVDTSPDADTIPQSPLVPEVRARSSSRSADKPARAVSVLGMSGKLIVSGPRDARIAAIAGHQRGRVNRRQLLAAGLGKSQIHRLIRADWLLREHAGVYAVGYRSKAPLGRETAALLAARDGAVLSHRSAAAVWGIDAVPVDPGVVHLLVDTDAETRRAGIRTHRSRTLRPADRRVHLELPVSSAARMLLDLATERDDRTLERATTRRSCSGSPRTARSPRCWRGPAATTAGAR
jgi:hypothetical protein